MLVKIMGMILGAPVVAAVVYGLISPLRYQQAKIEGESAKSATRGTGVVFLDTWTGSAHVVSADGVCSPVEPMTVIDKCFGYFGSSSKTLPGEVGVSVKVRWRCRLVYYVVNVQPFSDVVRKAREDGAVCTVHLCDDSGYHLSTLEARLGQMTQIVDDRGQVTGLEYQGHLPMDKEVFQGIDGFSVPLFTAPYVK